MLKFLVCFFRDVPKFDQSGKRYLESEWDFRLLGRLWGTDAVGSARNMPLLLRGGRSEIGSLMSEGVILAEVPCTQSIQPVRPVLSFLTAAGTWQRDRWDPEIRIAQSAQSLQRTAQSSAPMYAPPPMWHMVPEVGPCLDWKGPGGWQV